MDSRRTGALIRSLRAERRLTQRQVADHLGVSDKAVSKWERGGGCPDVALLPPLAKLLGTTVDTLLHGDLAPDDRAGGTMKRTAFHLCPTCGNVIIATGAANVSCCGRKLGMLTAQPIDEDHGITVEDIEGDWYVTFDHIMHKDHHIGFVAAVGYDRITVEKLYPEQGGEARIPRIPGADLYLYCTRHGLMRQTVSQRKKDAAPGKRCYAIA